MPGIISGVKGKSIEEPVLISYSEGLSTPDY